MNILIFGLSITSSWGNGHATTYRALIRELHQAGHAITFYERDVPWYANQRDLPDPPFCKTVLYQSLEELNQYYDDVFSADAIIIGSYVPEGVPLGTLLTAQFEVPVAFYDIDTPVTIRKMVNHDYEYLSPDLIARYDLYLSFSGGPILEKLQAIYGSRRAVPLYCSVDTHLYYPDVSDKKWKLGYMGTYSDDRQPTVEKLLIEPARELKQQRFVIAGPGYNTENWPENITYIPHLPPEQHRDFYNQQCFTLNVTRQDMIEAGYSPSVRLFEAAACGTPVISDSWEGLNSFFVPGKEILTADSSIDINFYLSELSQEEGVKIGQRARQLILTRHTAAHRARELIEYLKELSKNKTNEHPISAKN